MSTTTGELTAEQLEALETVRVANDYATALPPILVDRRAAAVQLAHAMGIPRRHLRDALGGVTETVVTRLLNREVDPEILSNPIPKGPTTTMTTTEGATA